VNAWDFWRMTPKEIQGRMTAHTRQQEQRMAQLDALAWMAGQYVGMAQNNPKKYPRQPQFYKPEVREKAVRSMGDDEMKTVLTGYAEIHNTIEGAKR